MYNKEKKHKKVRGEKKEKSLEQKGTKSRRFNKILNKGVCQLHCGLAIDIKKFVKAKEELWKLKYFTIAKIY